MRSIYRDAFRRAGRCRCAGRAVTKGGRQMRSIYRDAFRRIGRRRCAGRAATKVGRQMRSIFRDAFRRAGRWRAAGRAAIAKKGGWFHEWMCEMWAAKNISEYTV